MDSIKKKEDQNKQQLIRQHVDIAKRAVQLYDLKNYPLAKYIFILALEGIIKLQKQETDPELKASLTQKANDYFQLAEQCKKQLDAQNKQLQADPLVQQINLTMLEKKNTVKFEDIAGLKEVKEALYESIIYPNLRPDIFQGIRAPPRGILLFGPPGNGKTLIAKAVATESNATFYNISASNLMSKNLGEGEKLVKALFQCAYVNQPSIIFIDEIDSILKARCENEHEASRRLKTEFLIQFDGANSSDQDRVIVIGATNRPQEIDSAALRRFTKRILIDVPDENTRLHLIKYYTKEAVTSLNEKQMKELVKKIDGYSCSDIKALVKEACMLPLRKLKKNELLSVDSTKIKPVSIDDFTEAIKKVPPSLQKKELLYFKNLVKEYNKQV
ncbi:hypothetical protein ABPG74_009672 [Tetrahymena malaccensis]